MTGSEQYTNYGANDAAIARVKTVLGQMEMSQGDQQTVMNKMTHIFQGISGHENDGVQARFKTALAEHSAAITNLNAKIDAELATGGGVDANDKSIAGLFSGIKV